MKNIKGIAKLVANSYMDTETFETTLKDFFDLHPKDLDTQMHIETHISRENYEQLKDAKANGRKIDHDTFKCFDAIVLSLQDWINLSKNDVCVKISDDEVLKADTLPEYEEYLKAKKEISIKDLISNELFVARIASEIEQLAEIKNRRWYFEYRALTAQTLKDHNCNYDNKVIEDMIKRDHPHIIYDCHYSFES